MNKKQSRIEKAITKLLVKEGSQFYHPITGEPITTKEFVGFLVLEKKTDLDNFLANLKRKGRRLKRKFKK